MIGIIKDGGQNRDVSNIRPRHGLEPVEPAALPPELPEPVLAPFTFGSKTKRSTVSTSTVSGPALLQSTPSTATFVIGEREEFRERHRGRKCRGRHS